MRERSYPLLLAGLLAIATLLPATAGAQTVLGAAPPLIQAVEAGDLEAARGELLRGENPNMTDTDGQNPVIIAARNGDVEMIETLIQRGSSPNWQDEIGNSPLHWAVETGDWVVLDILLKNGANPNLTNRQGLTPVMTATRDGYRDLVERLLEAEPDLGIRDYTGRDVLDYARTSRAPGLEQTLMDAGAR
ncbi:ankyrin repeat domain-containing protein [Marivibrio halodurans]|uniref:Ankyrin repeat domain-containing protein n=1 Tax=Marivibrio halodurans TaxID=2039722 RepID=A0A8J7V3L6_9PROT|nr:ankyrin repeat domain-containing protein [Marivibrio halodurans]MBP5858087.1 ankyrin repeat domain-containing protein [Marivibrio halodurans]